MSKPHYTDVKQALYREAAPVDAAECHGVLCGMLCAHGSLSLRTWLDEFLVTDDAQRAESQPALRALFEATVRELYSEDLEFQPYLPDEAAPLHERTQALASWCQGYLYGLGASGIGTRSGLPDDTRELIEDFSALAQAQTGSGTAEELENVYAQLVEFIRVGVLLIQDELQPAHRSRHIH